eukprot:3181067-Rhodomonas_salina.5
MKLVQIYYKSWDKSTTSATRADSPPLDLGQDGTIRERGALAARGAGGGWRCQHPAHRIANARTEHGQRPYGRPDDRAHSAWPDRTC